MQNYLASENYLRELNIPMEQPVKITDEEQVKTLRNDVYSGNSLPEDITKRKVGRERIKDTSKIKEPLPEYIEKEEQEVTDPETLKSLHNKKEKDLELPSNYTYDRVWDKRNQEYKNKFYHKDQFNYYKKHYDFYKTRTLSEEEIRFLLESKKNVSMQSIASTLRFFKILVIVLIALYIFFGILSLIAAGAAL